MDPASILLFVRANWKLILIAALVVAVGVSQYQLVMCQRDFAEYKTGAIEAARVQQKKFDDSATEADLIFIRGSAQIITQTEIITKWITHNVENVDRCPDADFVRVFNASITGRLPEAESP